MFGSVLSGAQTTMHDWRMFRQLLRTLLLFAVLVVIGWVGWSGWLLTQTHPQQIKAAGLYFRATSIGTLQPDDTVYRFTYADGRPGVVHLKTLRDTPAFRDSYLFVRGQLFSAAISGALWAVPVVLMLLFAFGKRGQIMQRPKWLRGASLASVAQLNKLTDRSWRILRLPWWVHKGPRFSLAGVRWPRGGEMRHTLIVGTTGSGKTVAMSALLDEIRQSGGKAIIYDKMGSFIPSFYRGERDIILNPLDARSHDWDLFSEVRHEQDLDMIAAALIPASGDSADPFWTTAARQIFASGAAAMWKEGEASLPKLIDMLLRTNLRELAEAMDGTVEQSIIDPENAKTALSVRAILTTSTKPLSYLPPPRRPFSIRNWVEKADDSFLFLSSDAMGHERRKALIATQMEIATAALLSGAMQADRLWFIIDELPTLEQIPSLTSGLRESRQFGGCFVIGTQVVSELREIYGRNEAETISGNCNTRLILSTPDMATAEWCANGLGRAERERTLEGRSFGSNEIRDGVNISRREDIKPIVLPSEIMELEPLHGYIRIGGGFPVAGIKLRPKKRPKLAPHLIPAEQIDSKTGEVYEPHKESGTGSILADTDNSADTAEQGWAEPYVTLPAAPDVPAPNADKGKGVDEYGSVETAAPPAGRNAAHMATEETGQYNIPVLVTETSASATEDWYGVQPSGPVILGIPPHEDIPPPAPREASRPSRKARIAGKLASKADEQAVFGFDEQADEQAGDRQTGEDDQTDNMVLNRIAPQSGEESSIADTEKRSNSPLPADKEPTEKGTSGKKLKFKNRDHQRAADFQAPAPDTPQTDKTISARPANITTNSDTPRSNIKTSLDIGSRGDI